MSTKTDSPKPAPESQSQRRIKYGANVLVTAVIVVLLAGFLTYIAQRQNWRKDTTAAGLYSLKPQTISILDTLEPRLRLQKVQAVIDGDVTRVIDQVQAYTDAPAAPAPPPPAAQPAPDLAPAAKALSDKLATTKVTTRDGLRASNPDPAKLTEQLRKDLEDAAARASSALTSNPTQKHADDVRKAIATIQSAADGLKNFSPRMKIVGLFTKAKNDENQKVVEDVENKPEVRYQQVADLLSEYAQKSGGKIAVDMIDPTNEPERLAQLFKEVQEKFGNNVQKHRDVLDAYSATVKDLDATIKQQRTALAALPKVEDPQLARFLDQVGGTFDRFGAELKKADERVKEQLGLVVPDYAGATGAVQAFMTIMQALSGQVASEFVKVAADAKTPPEVKKFVEAAIPRFNSMKTASEGLLTKAADLPALKQFDELRNNKSNSIAVIAETDLKAIPMESIYPTDEMSRGMGEGKVKPRFAGEQQVSAAVVRLTSREKKKVAFVRSGSFPLTDFRSQIAAQQTGRPSYFNMAQRLRDLDVEVLEKDVSGMWAMQQMQQRRGMPPEPEPSDEDLKDAVWVVPMLPVDPQEAMMNPASGQLATKVRDHLRVGGSAMILVAYPRVQKLDFLKEDYGLDVAVDHIAVHDKIEAAGARASDRAGDWQRQSAVFIFTDYGRHPVTDAVRSLDGLMVPLVPVRQLDRGLMDENARKALVEKLKDLTVTMLLPIPETPRAWAESDFESAARNNVTYDPKPAKPDALADFPAPFFGGAAIASKNGDQRIMVLGSAIFPSDGYVGIPDEEVERTQGRSVPRFPGNAELFTNSAYWLLKMDPLIAISPSAMQIARIDPQMSDARRSLWRIILIAGLPALVLAAGTLVYLKRRD